MYEWPLCMLVIDLELGYLFHAFCVSSPMKHVAGNCEELDLNGSLIQQDSAYVLQLSVSQTDYGALLSWWLLLLGSPGCHHLGQHKNHAVQDGSTQEKQEDGCHHLVLHEILQE